MTRASLPLRSPREPGPLFGLAVRRWLLLDRQHTARQERRHCAPVERPGAVAHIALALMLSRGVPREIGGEVDLVCTGARGTGECSRALAAHEPECLPHREGGMAGLQVGRLTGLLFAGGLDGKLASRGRERVPLALAVTQDETDVAGVHHPPERQRNVRTVR